MSINDAFNSEEKDGLFLSKRLKNDKKREEEKEKRPSLCSVDDERARESWTSRRTRRGGESRDLEEMS